MIGKWHLMPSEFESAAGPYDRWPLGRGFDRFYGFLGGDTSQWYPDLVADNHQVEPPKTPEQGYHLTEDLADKAIGFIADAKQVAPTSRSCILHRRRPRPAPCGQGVGGPYQGQFDDGWDAYRERVFARQKELGIMPADAELSRHDPDAGLGQPAPRRPPAGRPDDGGVRRVLVPHRPSHRRLLDFLKETGEFDNTLIMVISDNGASAEGGVTGTTNEGQFFNNAPEPLEDSLNKIDELGGPTTFNHYPWGRTWAGNTLPAVEAGDLPGRRLRSVPGPLAGRHQRPWRGPRPVRPHHRHGPDRAGRLGIEPPATIRGVTQAPIHGVSFAPSFDDQAALTRHTTQYFEMFGHRSIDHDGRRRARGRARRSPRPASRSARRSRPRS